MQLFNAGHWRNVQVDRKDSFKGYIMARILKEKKVKIITQEELDRFESRCKHFAEEVKQYTKQTNFIKECKKAYVGNDERKRSWGEKERELKVDILEKYFPGTKEKIIQYEKDELQSMANRERARQEKERLKELN